MSLSFDFLSPLIKQLISLRCLLIFIEKIISIFFIFLWILLQIRSFFSCSICFCNFLRIIHKFKMAMSCKSLQKHWIEYICLQILRSRNIQTRERYFISRFSINSKSSFTHLIEFLPNCFLVVIQIFIHLVFSEQQFNPFFLFQVFLSF